MSLIPPHIFISFDSSGFSPPVNDEKSAADKLFKLIEEHKVTSSITEGVMEETSSAPNPVRKLANAQIFDLDLFDSKDEQLELEIKKLLFGSVDDLSSSKINDARILVCAKKYNCTYFVTYDKKHILNNRIEIKSKLGFEVVTPSECLEKLHFYLV